MMKTALAPLLVALFLFLSVSDADISNKVGICYGQLGNNLPSPSQSAKLIQSLKASRVKIYDANPDILNALKNTDMEVSIMVPNGLINNISSTPSLADQWVRDNVLPYTRETKIRYLLVGNEILSSPDNLTWSNLVPAMEKMENSLRAHGVHKVKVGTPLAMDMLESSSLVPPSNGTFRSDFSDSVIRPMLEFLNRTKSFFFIDVYPYFSWLSDPTNINLDYALLEAKNITYTDTNTNLTYTNLFDQLVDAVVFAMERLGYPNIPIFIAETGWPNGGDFDQIGANIYHGFDQIGANIYNAATYNRNIVKKLTEKPAVGTPARPGRVLASFIFALYNENQKLGIGTERHFGLLYPNGTNVYEIDLSGVEPKKEYKPLPKPTNNEPYKGKIWCVAAKGANTSALASALTYACARGNGTCDPIKPGKPCFKPDSLFWHASYAFSSYYAQFKKIGGNCNFNGLATQVVKDPSSKSCKFPSVTL